MPVLLFVPAGGPADADGNVESGARGGMAHRPYAQLAASLARHGYAAARFSRSAPEPSGRWRPVEDRAGDCVAAAEALRREPSLDGSRLVLVGHGQGGLVALAAARAAKAAGVILLETPAKPVHEVVADQLLRDHQQEDLEEGRRPAFEASLRSFRDRLLRAAEGAEVEYAGRLLPPAVARYIRSLYCLQPAELAEDLEMPALVVQGTGDAVVGTDNGALLARALPRGDLRIIDGMTHGLTLAAGEGPDGSAVPPATPLHPLLIWTLLAWLRQVAPPLHWDADDSDAETAGTGRRAVRC